MSSEGALYGSLLLGGKGLNVGAGSAEGVMKLPTTECTGIVPLLAVGCQSFINESDQLI